MNFKIPLKNFFDRKSFFFHLNFALKTSEKNFFFKCAALNWQNKLFLFTFTLFLSPQAVFSVYHSILLSNRNKDSYGFQTADAFRAGA